MNKDRIKELINTLIGYAGMAVIVLAIIIFVDGRIGSLKTIGIMFLGFLIMITSTILEIKRAPEEHKWVKKTFEEAYMGDLSSIKKALKEDK